MIIAGVVIETLPGREPDVAARLTHLAGLELKGGDGHARIAAVWTAESGADLERRAENLLLEDADVLGVYPIFVGEDPE